MFRIVVVGASLGGFNALRTLLRELPEECRLPLIITQHRDASSDGDLVGLLSKYASRPVLEPDDKQVIHPGAIYVAPADYHLLVDAGHFALSTEARVSSARPSIDVLFESASQAYGSAVLALVLTGSSRDGVRGSGAIRQRGGRVLVQEPATAESPVLPEAVIASGAFDWRVGLAEIPAFLGQLCVGSPQGSALVQRRS